MKSNRRIRRFKKNNQKTEKIIINEKTSFFSNIIQVISLIPAFGTLFLLWYGYEHTIKPVYQKDLLQEEVSKLKLEQLELTRNIDEQKAIQKDLSNKNSNLNYELNRTALALKESKAYLKDQTTLLKILKSDTERYQNLASENKALLLAMLKAQLSGSNKVPEIFGFISGNSKFKPDIFRSSPQNLAVKLKSAFNQPYEIAISQLSSLERTMNDKELHPIEKNSYRELFKEYQRNLPDVRASLTCNVPNFKKWQNSYTEAHYLINNKLDYCVKTAIKNSYSYNPNISIESFINNMDKDVLLGVQNDCRSNMNFAVGTLFTQKWLKDSEGCKFRKQKVNDIVFKAIKKEELPNQVTPQPPSIKAIEDKIDNSLEGIPDMSFSIF